VAANRALVDFLGLAQVELAGQIQDALQPDEGEPLVRLIGYTAAELEADCRALDQGEETIKQSIVVSGPPERHVERTPTPVQSWDKAITGWLLVFRDVTEEIELARLRDDTTHMLVHDLHSPMTVVKGSLGMIRLVLAAEEKDELEPERPAGSRLAAVRTGRLRYGPTESIMLTNRKAEQTD